MGTSTKVIVKERLEDYVVMGRYVVYVCILAELVILPQVCAVFYMMYAGLAPRVIECNGVVFDEKLEGKEICFKLEEMTNCTHPTKRYQFHSVNVEFNYYCKTSKLVKNSISIQMAGALFGAVFFGQLSDRLGRKWATQAALIGAIVCWLVLPLSQDLFQFTVVRTVITFFIGGSISVINVFIMENIPKKHRVWINMAITWSPNFPLLAIAAWLTQDWRLLSYVNAAICVPAVLFFHFFVHESPRWLITKGRVEEAKQLMLEQFRVSKQEFLIGKEFDDVVEVEYTKARQKTKTQYHYYHLFCTKSMTVVALVIAFSYCSISIMNYGIMFNMEKLSGSVYWNSVWTGLIRYICNLICGLADLKYKWVGRKIIHSSGLVIIILCLSFVVSTYVFHVNHEMKEGIRIALLIGSSMSSQIYIANGIVGNELFPTPMRNMGYSFLQLWNRFGVVIAPLIFYLNDFWIALPFITMTVLCSLDAVFFEFLLPETKGRPMVENMPPRETWLFDRKNESSELQTLESSNTEEIK